ncbi:hypothetical protein [Novosphingobium sp. CECT 9465]|uniref:hypothetical protein n=1 Tax=Novosphingobium sp. CECT 9465 TaxID=2829794 RepID=UPI001E48363D|nr:hypothetical protein [Novosphingobium sp. CECT 9465]
MVLEVVCGSGPNSQFRWAAVMGGMTESARPSPLFLFFNDLTIIAPSQQNRWQRMYNCFRESSRLLSNFAGIDVQFSLVALP